MTDPLQKQYPSAQREASVTTGDESVGLSGGAATLPAPAATTKVEPVGVEQSPLRRVLHSYFSGNAGKQEEV